MKNNPNQICWLLEKLPRSSSTQHGFTTFQQFLDNQQYTNRGILRYEKMFGAGYVSTGGPSTTKVGIKPSALSLFNHIIFIFPTMEILNTFWTLIKLKN